MQQDLTPDPQMPDWIPAQVRLYLGHAETGLSLRELARREGRHASTVMRIVRRWESRRDDPLTDEALASLSRGRADPPSDPDRKDTAAMSAPIRSERLLPEEDTIAREARRVLRRMAETGAVLALAADMDKAAVVRTDAAGQGIRTAVVDRAVAQAFLLKDWIVCRRPGRVATYELTTAGRHALRRLIETEDRRAQGLAEDGTPFAGQHRDWGDREVQTDQGPRRMRCNLAESPVHVLARRREKDGKPFLAADLVEAADRLREDFELAQMGPRVAQNWDRFLTPGDRGAFRPDSGMAEGPRRARDRVAAALRDLGPGLGDMVLRCCCFLEGLEAAEQRMGWSARSGKIVLRIALQRLRRHYDETYGRSGPLIG